MHAEPQYEHTLPALHDGDDSSLGAALLARRFVPELQQLSTVRKKGWGHEGLDTHFRNQRKVADSKNEDACKFWFKMMKSGMQEMDTAVALVPAIKPIEFLDIGCSPGGFSSYILEKNKRARGTGISLPVTQGGHHFRLEDPLRARYQFIEQDILYYDFSPPCLDGPPDSMKPFPNELHNRFALVLLDGHALRIYSATPDSPPLDQEANRVYRGCLLIAQLIIALESVSPGGTIVMKLSRIENFPATQLLYLLDELSETLVAYKPRAMHANRGTFYAVAKGVYGGKHCAHASESRVRLIKGLKELWYQLKYGGPHGAGRTMTPQDLDFIVTTETIMDEYIDRLIELGRSVWSTQLHALRVFFRKKGM